MSLGRVCRAIPGRQVRSVVFRLQLPGALSAMRSRSVHTANALALAEEWQLRPCRSETATCTTGPKKRWISNNCRPPASVVNLNATTYLYDLRDNGNSDIALAVASHYLHCRYITSKAYLPGAIIGTVAVVGYDGVWKLIEKYLSRELSVRFGKSPVSKFNRTMLAWDMQGLSDGLSDFLFSWGYSLYAPYHPMTAGYP